MRVVNERELLPPRRSSENVEIESNGITMTITVGRYPDGRPGEAFVSDIKAGTHADAVADFGGDATVGVDAAASNTTYYGDGLHPTAACYAFLGPILTTAVNGL